jgi:hypothetical protein
MRILISAALGCIALSSVCSTAFALTFPFNESFSNSDSNWKDNASLALTHVATGGAAGDGYVSTEFSFEGLTAGPAIFRGQNNFDSSGDAFLGNWTAAGVGVVRAYTRHDAPVPIDYFVRIATSGNFPAVNVELPYSVPAGPDWTLLEFDTSFSNPLVTVEAIPGQEVASYNAVFGGVGNIQFGVSLPESLTTDPSFYTFDLDEVSIGVPEPSNVLIALGCLVCGLVSRVRQSRIG